MISYNRSLKTTGEGRAAVPSPGLLEVRPVAYPDLPSNPSARFTKSSGVNPNSLASTL